MRAVPNGCYEAAVGAALPRLGWRRDGGSFGPATGTDISNQVPSACSHCVAATGCRGSSGRRRAPATDLGARSPGRRALTWPGSRVASRSTTAPARSASSGCGHRTRPAAGAGATPDTAAPRLTLPSSRSTFSTRRTVDPSVSMRAGPWPTGVLARFGGKRRQRAVTPPDVDEVRRAVDVHEQRQVVEVGAEPAGRWLERSTRQQVDRVAEPAQQFGEASVQLEAPTAPPLLDDLVVRPSDVDPDPDTMEHVEVLERYAHQVSGLELRQRGRRRLPRAVIADAGEVPVDVERHHVRRP